MSLFFFHCCTWYDNSSPEKHWSVFFGHYEERVYPNGDKMIEPMIDYSFVLYGEELQLVGFIAEQFASDEESEGFRVFP